MLELSKLNEIQLIVFGLVLIRMTSFVVSAAIFSSPSINSPLKILFSLALSMLIYNRVAVPETIVRISEIQNEIMLLALFEAVMGLILGFLTRLFFFSISMAGEMISVALGLGQSQLFNPLLGSQGNAIEQFLMLITTLVFFTIDGHHMLIQGLMQSFNIIPLARLSINLNEFKNVVLMAQDLFIVAIKVSAPIVISMLVVQFGVGLLGRAVPQVNVLTTSMAITVFLGMFILIISLPLMIQHMDGVLEVTTYNFFNFIKKI